MDPSVGLKPRGGWLYREARGFLGSLLGYGLPAVFLLSTVLLPDPATRYSAFVISVSVGILVLNFVMRMFERLIDAFERFAGATVRVFLDSDKLSDK